MKKLIGYLVALFGLLLIAFIVKPLKDLAFAKAISGAIGPLANIILVAVGAVLVVVGVFLLTKSRGKKVAEVPIYQGKDIVGFRRFGKK